MSLRLNAAMLGVFLYYPARHPKDKVTQKSSKEKKDILFYN